MTTQFVDTLPPPIAAPKTRARHAANLSLADECRANPGRWLLYPYDLDTPRFLRYRINNGKDRAFGAGFEAEMRNGRVFITYTNPKDAR
jgi:hypothetical protein